MLSGPSFVSERVRPGQSLNVHISDTKVTTFPYLSSLGGYHNTSFPGSLPDPMF